jgi:hypothetical protein
VFKHQSSTSKDNDAQDTAVDIVIDIGNERGKAGDIKSKLGSVGKSPVSIGSVLNWLVAAARKQRESESDSRE